MKTIVLGYDGSPEASRALDTDRGAGAGARAHASSSTSVAPTLQPAGRGIGPYDPVDPPEH